MYGYGNEQSQYTLNRASYGDVPAGMMMGMRTTYGGAYDGINNMMSDVGRMVMPVGYTPPARVNVGFYGQYQQQMGFFSSGAGVLGLNGPGRSQMAADYMYNVGSDFGERLGGGAAGIAATVGSMGVGSMMGRFLGGGIVGSLAGGFIGSAAAGVVMDAVSQRRDINNFLENSSYRYVTSSNNMVDQRRGGFNAQGRSQVTDMIRGMDIKDPFTSTEDLTMILQQGTQKGMFAGTQDMNDFKKKFKELTETVKVVTRTLNQTLEESMHTIKELKSIGVDPGQASGVVRSAQMFGNMAGRTGGEMLNVGLQGAELFRGTGVNMGIGAQATMMNLATVRAARDAGQLSNEAIAQAGGEEALSMRMNASGLGFAQSTLGRGFGAAFFNPGMAGGFNAGQFMQSAMGGGMSLMGMAGQAVGNLASPARLIAYQANQEKFMSEAGKTFGGQGLQIMQMMTTSAQAQFLSQATGAKFEDAYRLSAKQMGMSQSEIDAQIGMARGSTAIYASANNAAQMAYEKNMIEEGYRQNRFVNFGSQVRDDMKSVVDVIATPISRTIDSIKESVVSFTEKHTYGVDRRTLGDTDYVVTNASKELNGRRLKVTNIDEGGGLGGQTAGSLLNSKLSKNMKDAFGVTTREVSSASELRDGEVIIKDPLVGSKIAARVEDIADKTKNWNFSKDDVTKAADKLISGGTILGKIATTGHSINNLNDLAMAAFGKSADKLSKIETMSLDATLGNHSTYGAMIREGKELAGVVGNARSTEDSKRVIDSLDARDSALNRYTASVASHSKISADRLQTGAARNSLLALADASLETDTKKRTNMMDSISKDLITQGFTNKEAQAIMASGNKNQSITQAAVDGQKNYNDATRTLAGGRLSQVIEYQAKNSAMSAEKISQVTTVAKLLGSASSVDDFKNVAAKYAPLLKESGAAGHNVVDTTAKMKKIQALKANDISGMKAVLGNDWNESYAEAARNKGTQGVVNQLYQNTQKGIMGNSVATGPGGVTDAGGTTAAQTLTQQVSINSEILAVMQGLAQRLKVK